MIVLLLSLFAGHTWMKTTVQDPVCVLWEWRCNVFLFFFIIFYYARSSKHNWFKYRWKDAKPKVTRFTWLSECLCIQETHKHNTHTNRPRRLWSLCTESYFLSPVNSIPIEWNMLWKAFSLWYSLYTVSTRPFFSCVLNGYSIMSGEAFVLERRWGTGGQRAVPWRESFFHRELLFWILAALMCQQQQLFD